MLATDQRPATSPVDIQPESSWSETVKTSLRPWLAWIVAVWSLGVVVCSLRPLLGWHTLRRLQQVGVSPVSDDVLAVLRCVSAQRGLRHTVRVLQSTLAQVPVVVGYLRPVILLPVSLLTTIPAAQLEAILAHELAHVARHDFVVNLLQTLIETLFFYHPAVWWLSRQIRIEREHCCDDLVVKLLGNRVEYGRALVAIEELRGQNSILALGASGGSLLSRVRRIVGPNVAGSQSAAVRLGDRWPVVLFSLASLGAALALSMSWNLTAKGGGATDSQMTATYAAQLPDGMVVELLGVGDENTPISNWWKADGRRLDSAPADRLPLGGSSPPPSAYKLRNFVYRVSGLAKTQVVSGRARGPCVRCFSTAMPELALWERHHSLTTQGNGDLIANLVVPISSRLRPTNVCIDVTSREWWQPMSITPALEIRESGEIDPHAKELYGLIRVTGISEEQGLAASFEERVRGVPYPPQATLAIEWDPSLLGRHAEMEIDALEKSGERHPLHTWGDPKRTRGRTINYPHFACRLADVDHFEIRLRPIIHRVTFENVSLQPGQTTVVNVKSESLADDHLPSAEKYQSATYLQKKISAKIPDVAWGEARNGLRLAIVVRDANNTEWNDLPADTLVPDSLKVQPGEEIRCQLVVENVSDHEIDFSAYDYTEIGRSIEVLNRQGETADVHTAHLMLLASPTHWRLQPGERFLLQMPPIHFFDKQPDQGIGYFVKTVPGDYTLRCSYTFGESNAETAQPAADTTEWTGTLSTAALKVTVADSPPSDEQNGATEEVSSDSPRSPDTRAEKQSPAVVGTVVTPDDKPVSGIEVMAFEGGKRLDQKFKTDERGQFRVPKAWRESDHYLTLVVRDERQRLGWFDFFFHAHSDNGQKADDGSFRLVLLPLNRTIRGKLLDESGKPLAQVPVDVEYLQHEVNFASTHWKYQKVGNQALIPGGITGDEGQFEVNLPADSYAWLGAVHPDWVYRRIQVTKDKDEVSATRLVRAARIAGRVIDSRTGKPVAGVGIGAQAIEPDMQSGGWGDATTDAGGNYVIGGMAAGDFNIMLLEGADKRLTAPAYPAATLKSGETYQADFVLSVGKRLAGRVVDAQTNQPIADCTVSYSGPARPGGAVLSAKTNERGEFEFFVPPGQSHIYVAESRIIVANQSCDVDVPADQDADPVVLKAGAKLEGNPAGFKIFVGPPLDRKVSLHIQRAPLVDVLEKLCQSAAVKLEFDDDGLTGAGYTKDMPVTIDADRITLRAALTQVLGPFEKLSFAVDKDQIFVSIRARVEAREKTQADPTPQRDGKTRKDSATGQDSPLKATAAPEGLVRGEEPADATEIVRPLLPSIVLVIRTNAKTGRPEPNPNWQAGVIVDERGYILTTLPRDELIRVPIAVRLFHQSEYPAEVVATDPRLQLAVLRIRPRWPLTAISIAKVQVPKVPDTVIEVPSPAQKVTTTGAVTALGRSVETFPPNLIQSDLAIPLGEAGSLMVTDKGEPAGIWWGIRAGKTRTSFAVPLQDVLPFLAKTVPQPTGDKAEAKPADPKGDEPAASISPETSVVNALPKGLEFLASYPRLHGLSLDMTEKQFLAIAEKQELKPRKTADGGSTQYLIPTGDGHTVIVMFGKGSSKCTGIQRIRGEEAPQRVNGDGNANGDPRPDDRPGNDSRKGTLTGRFVYDGEPPVRKDLHPDYSRIDVDQPQKPNSDGRFSGVEGTFRDFLKHDIRPSTLDATLLVGKDGGIANVVVWVVSKDIPWVPPQVGEQQPATIQLKNGNYAPRITTLTVGQPLLVENHDPVVFNFHLDLLRNNAANNMLPPRSVENPRRWTFTKAENLPAHFRSENGPWATGWVFIRQNPYVAVSRADGSFTLPDLPAGNWEFRVWHERKGYLEYWPKGLFKQGIKSGENDLGTIKLKPEFFGETPPKGAANARPEQKDREQIGEVLGKPVYRDELKSGSEASLAGAVRHVFFGPIWKKDMEAHKVELTPTEGELAFAAEIFDKKRRDEIEAAGGEAKIREQIKALDEQLARPDVVEKQKRKLQLDHTRLTQSLHLPGRSFAAFILDNWKLQKHLYDEYGGGRILWQQAGTEAFDATRQWMEAQEKKGEFKITDARLRAKLYEYWTRDDHPSLFADPELIRQEFVEPEWIAPARVKIPANNR